jgi:hypothetical protein
MKLFTNKTTLAALALATLAACGGGGGSSAVTPPAATTYTASTTCATGPALTSTVSQAAADALVPASCPALTSAQLSAIAVNRSATGALTLTGLPTGVAWSAKSVTFTKGSTSVTGTVDAAGNITPTSALAAGTWTVTFTGQPALAPAVTNLTLTSVIVPVVLAPCVAPNVNNTVTGACVTVPTGYTFNPNLGGGGAAVANIGVLVTGANTLPAACLTVGDACWVSSVQNGTIKFVNSGVTIAPINNRPIVFAYYVTATGYYNTQPVYADDGAPAASTGVSGGGNANIYLDVKGVSNGVRQSGIGACGELTYNGTGAFSSNLISCPI